LCNIFLIIKNTIFPIIFCEKGLSNTPNILSMPKSVKLCVEKLKTFIEKECKKISKDEPHSIDEAAIEKIVINSAPLKRGSKNPDAPKTKRPLSGYMLFGQEVRPKIKAEHPNFAVTEVMQEVGKRWKQLSDDEKAKYSKK